MAAAVAPLPAPVALPPVAPVAAAPVLADVGHLDKQIEFLRTACLIKDEEKGVVVANLIRVVALVAAVVAGLAFQGMTGLVIGAAIYFIGGNLVAQMYHNLRNRDYEEAGTALNFQTFKKFIADKDLNPTVDTIVQIHKQYKNHTAAEAKRLLA